VQFSTGMYDYDWIKYKMIFLLDLILNWTEQRTEEYAFFFRNEQGFEDDD
jgi:hypothetical protein